MQVEIWRRDDIAARPELIQEMFRQRRKVFIHRLGWQLPEQDHFESDAFDALPEVIYVAAIISGKLVGALRLLPTTGPTILERYFPDDFARLSDSPSSCLWECSRFYALPADPGDQPRQPNISLSLLHGLCAHALARGITRIVGSFEGRMHRIYTRLGWPPARVEPSINGEGFIGVWDVSREALNRMERKLETGVGAPANTNTPAPPAFDRRPITPVQVIEETV